jgi:hypothetical protein
MRTGRSRNTFIWVPDDNDAVQFDDAYSKKERRIINKNKGSTVQERYIACQQLYKLNRINATFKNVEEVGHWTTSPMNLAVIKFFRGQMDEKL